jgi:NAD(P)-dependent dehydrogenase (short-subunit alcohol dehydrogenase family)
VDDVVATVAFVAGPEGYLTGAKLTVNGGATLRGAQ